MMVAVLGLENKRSRAKNVVFMGIFKLILDKLEEVR